METEFDNLFATRTKKYEELDKRIAKTQAKKASLLLVLKYPELPLHNNPAELAVRQRVHNWWEQILNYFDGRYNNGFAEGVNLKIKMLNRCSFGYRNFSSFRLHVLVAFDPTSR